MIKQKEGFFQGILYLMISQVIIKVLGMVYSLYLTNKNGFGDEGNAICMAGFQVYALVLGLCAICVPNSVSKMVSESYEMNNQFRCRRILRVALFIFSGIGFLFCLILYYFSDFIAIHILSIPASSEILRILAPSIIFSCIESVYRGYFNGIKKISVSAKSACLEQIIKTFFTVILVEKIGELTNFDTVLMAKGSMLAASIATIFSFLYSYIKFKRIGEEVDNDNFILRYDARYFTILKQLLVISIPISLTTAVTIFGNNIDSITIVRLLKNEIGEIQAQKIYGIITSKINLLISLPLSLNGAVSISLIPEISRNVMSRNIIKLNKNIKFSVFITLCIAIPITIFLFSFPKQIMHFLYPNAPLGANLLRIGSFSIIFSCLTQNISGILQGIGDSKSHLRAVLIGMIIKFFLNFILISNKSILERGAIISSILSDFVIFLYMLKKYKKSMKALKNE